MDLQQSQSNEFFEKLKSRFDSIKTGVSDSPWKSNPIGIREFVSSKDHMAFPEITPRQMDALIALLGEDPLTMFTDRKYKVGVFLAGKGSGKDLLSCIALCYIIYVLLHLKNPQLYLFKADLQSESIDLVNVAPSAEVASYVFFSKLRNRMKTWKWLRKNYKVKFSMKELDPKTTKNLNQDYVTVNLRDIIFPNNIRCFSRHSESDLSEGFNILFGVMDEASAFIDPDATFSTLESSADSRFPKAYRIFVLSFPRDSEQDDFTCRLANQALSDTEIYVLHGATWEILPSWKFSGQTFDFQTEKGMIKVPVEYEKKFLEDPVDALKKYAAIAPRVSSGKFYTMPEKIRACVNADRVPIAEYSDIIVRAPTGDERVGKELSKFNIPRQPDVIHYYAHIDYGLVKDSATIAVGHQVNGVAVVDLILEWIPDRINKRPVDLDNVISILIELKKRLINLVFVGADQFQSAQAIQTLQNNGIVAERVSVDKTSHIGTRTSFYTSRVDMLNDAITIGQLENLVDYGSKVAAPMKGKHFKEVNNKTSVIYKDDKAIATTGLIHTLIGPDKGGKREAIENEGSINTENDSAFSGMGMSIHLH